MPEVVSKKAYRINVKNLVYATLTTDTSTGCTYAAPKPFSKTRQIQISPKICAGELFGDGALDDVQSKIVGYDVQIDVNKVPVETQAVVYGHKIATNGTLIKGKADQSPYIALGLEIEQSNGERELVWLLKGKAQPNANTVQQTENNMNYSTESVKLSFVAREFDGNFEAICDTAYTTVTPQVASAFLTAVPTTFA